MRPDVQPGIPVAQTFSFTIVDTVAGLQAAHLAEAAEIRRLRAAGTPLYNRITGAPTSSRIFWALHAQRARANGPS